jgi:hypothetical protein
MAVVGIDNSPPLNGPFDIHPIEIAGIAPI